MVIKRSDNPITGWELKENETGWEIFECGIPVYKIIDHDIERSHICNPYITIFDNKRGTIELMPSSQTTLHYFDTRVPQEMHDKIAAKMIPKMFSGR